MKYFFKYFLTVELDTEQSVEMNFVDDSGLFTADAIIFIRCFSVIELLQVPFSLITRPVIRNFPTRLLKNVEIVH